MQSIPRGRPILSKEVRGTSARGQFQFRALTPSRKRSVPFAAPRQVDTQDHAWDSLCCHVHREFMRNAVLNLTLIIPATAYHQRNYVERYSRYSDRPTEYPLPSYSPDYHPIEYLWKKTKQRATHNKYFKEFATLTVSVDKALAYFATPPEEVLGLSLNLSHFVACKIWWRRGVPLLRGRAHRLQRREPFRCLLTPMDIFFDLLQTAIN